MQTNILDVLTENAPLETEYSFVIDQEQANNVIGHAKEVLEDNNYMVKHVRIIALTAQVVIVRYSFQDLIHGWETYDSAIMLSAIKRVYKGEGRELVFNSESQQK